MFENNPLSIGKTEEHLKAVGLRFIGRDNVGVNSWFSEIRQASLDINPDGRIVWVEVEGVPLKLWSMNSFRRIASKWGDLIDVDDIEEYCFHSKRLCLFTKCHTNIFETFKINFHGKVYWIRAKEVPGWVPELLEESDEEEQSIDGCMEGDNNNNDENNVGDKSDTSEIPETVFDKSSGQKENKSEDPFDLYPLLNKNKKGMMDKVKEVNSSPLYPPGFTPNNETNDNCGMGENFVNCNAEEEINVGGGGSDNAKSKEYGESMSSGRFKRSEAPRTGGSFLGLMEEVVKVGQTMGYNMEGVMEKIDMFNVRRCWGNLAFEFLHSDSVGNSSGVWIKNGTDLLIIVVYAPHDSRDKRMLWDYLVHVVNQWHGEVVIMGDFNEVRYKSDRFGSNFNVHGADAFNAFFSAWCAITLDRYLSDHRPILLREKAFDFGPIPFRFFHHWFEIDGFRSFVSDTWNCAPVVSLNGMRNMAEGSKDGDVCVVTTKKMEVSQCSRHLHLGFPLTSLDFCSSQRLKITRRSSQGLSNPFRNCSLRVPSKVLQVLESIRGQFFNGHDVGSNKATWVKWNSVLADKKHGGLGVSSLYALNRGLILKWVWKFLTQKESLWTKVITAIHRVNGNLYSEFKMGGRSCWLSIVNEIRVLQIKGVWSLENSGKFTVVSTRKLIDGVRLPKTSDMTRWVKCVPIKVNILAWKIRSDALPTRINISRRGIDIQSISRPICDHGAKTSDHLFFKCNMVREIGRKIARWWNINFQEVNSYEDWKTWIVSCRMDTKLKHMFEGIWYSLWWYVWNYRNKLLFDDKIPMNAVIFDNVISSSFYWCKSRCKASFAWNDWLKNPYLISF
ncbi:RNA-directed DNA polymerase, eukaryota, reverse transcriptase zinc-binding domain protein [Tanacetum coccineum]